MNQELLAKQAKSLNPWLALHGWAFIIVGGFSSLTILGAILGVPLIIAGASLISSGKDFKEYTSSGNIDELISALKEQKRFFIISGLVFFFSTILPFLMAVSLILAVIFNPQFSNEFNHEFKDLMDQVPQIQKQIPYDFGKAKEV
jgi:hypothetical protein